MAIDSGRGEGDLAIGLASSGSGGVVSPSPAVRRPGLVMSSSEKRLDQAVRRNMYDRKNDTELHLAAKRGDLDAVRQILAEIDAQITSTGEEFDSDVAKIRATVVNEPNNLEETALLLAAERGYTDIVVELLKHSDLESLVRTNRSGFSALYVAAREGHRDVVKVMLDHNTSLALTSTRSNVTPLITASIRGHLEVVKLLLERDSAVVRISKTDGKNALHFAARWGHVEIVKALLESDCQLARRTDKKGQTALHTAVKGTSAAVVKALVNADPAIVMQPDRSGNLPLHVATRKKRSELVRYIQEISSHMEGSLIIGKTEEKQNILPILYGIESIDKTTLEFNDKRSQGYSQLQRERAIIARSELDHLLFDESAEPKPLPLLLLEHITSGFSDDKKIGSGGFAIVYKGMLECGLVAVKKLLETVDIDDEKFTEEVRCLMKTKHKNIVRFLGYCADTQGEMVNFEGKHVLADASYGLKWRNRYKIIIGICDGLYYLHQMQIVHLDLKPENILLDDNMMPKIADFGLSRCFDDKQSRAIASKVFGTMGYMAPELLCGRQITFKSDIYSLGIILIRILTGEKGYPCPDIDNVLESWRNRLEKSEVDTQLLQIRVCTEIAIDCTEWNPEKRPDIHDIIARLGATKSARNSATEIGTRAESHPKLQKLNENTRKLAQTTNTKSFSVQKYDILAESGYTSSLENCEMENCEGIMSLPDRIQQLTKLEYLVIRGFPTLMKWCESEGNKMKLPYIKELLKSAKAYKDAACGSMVNNKRKKPLIIEETIHDTLIDEVHPDLYSNGDEHACLSSPRKH